MPNDLTNQSPILLIVVEYINPDYISHNMSGGDHEASNNTIINLDFNYEDYVNVLQYDVSNENKTIDNKTINAKNNNQTRKIMTASDLNKANNILMKLLFDDKLLKILNKKLIDEKKVKIDFNIDMLLNLIDRIKSLETSKINKDQDLKNIFENLNKKLYINDIAIKNDKTDKITYELFKSAELYNLLHKKFQPLLNERKNSNNGLVPVQVKVKGGYKKHKSTKRNIKKITKKINKKNRKRYTKKLFTPLKI
jgi:hypothetical protein